ncbi:hypothetical protein AB0M31_13895 [Streptomyces sp. NPDC051773]|uniref:hypothetical protein n=1 Tax=Streptomyces sp. NPDC051773 TaxID=3156682 RepID=UPI003417DAD7
MPVPRRRAPAVPHRHGPSAALVHGFLLIAVLLCTLAHGPSGEPHGPSGEPPHRPPAPTAVAAATVVTAATAVPAVTPASPVTPVAAVTLTAPGPPTTPAPPHGPHGHHAAEECPTGGLPRTPTAQTAAPPPAVAGPVLLFAGITSVAPAAPGPRRRRPHRRRRCRTGRIVLARTARWRT